MKVWNFNLIIFAFNYFFFVLFWKIVKKIEFSNFLVFLLLFHKGSFTDEELGLDPNDPDIVEKRKEALRKLRFARKSEILL